MNRTTRQLCFPGVAVAVLFALLALRAHATLDAPVSPNALPGVAAELQFFKNIQGRYIVGGQQEIAWSEPRAEEDVNYIVQHTGRTPGLRGFDFLQYTYSSSVRANQHSTERAIAWARAGGLVTYCCHMFMDIGSTNGTPQFYTPGSNGNPTGTNFDIRQAVVAGTPENTEYLAKLDLIAAELRKLRDAGVVVIWRPFHEAGGTWFWWSRYGAAPFKAAWQIMFERFTQIHGLTNLIWCFNPTDASTVMAGWYPGDAMVDMISLDVYPPPGTHPTYSSDYKAMRDFRVGRKVVVMSENGSIPDIDAMFAEGGSWGYFCTWNGFENDLSRNSLAFLDTVFNHARVLTRDELPSQYWFYSPDVVIDTPSQSVTAGANATFTATGPAGAPLRWQCNGVEVPGAGSATLTLTNMQPANTGLYVALSSSGAGERRSAAALVGLSTTAKVVGGGVERWPNIIHQNGNVFDQVQLTGAAEAITADSALGQITRTSFLDVDGDIVQVEFSGPGTLSLVLDEATAPAPAANYNQPDIQYVQGHAGIVITGATADTNVSVFTVGRATAVNQTLFKDEVNYDGVADVAFIAIASSDGRFGDVRAANATFFTLRGYTGLYAPGVVFGGPVYLGNVSAYGSAQSVILLGGVQGASRITGGDLYQENGAVVQVSGLTQLKFTGGSDSHGNAISAKPNAAVLKQNDLDVTAQIVVNP
ncbi:glycosyl hydrolase [Opitutus terrae]|uniref:Mannan endo-1,4-beta-mannosidase n=1 Tax=Opitutus terrae (strain DSM 11246 / JCM 15787 / PB90-1) TaxID=452637 RepID=B1ZWJ9_OPITP|nr:glycosyl hydrolase [Opitutus terrae]ACB73323.1 Mannan endo-1,4-beta-mannosidase [Opitutus terrae PB90-1]